MIYDWNIYLILYIRGVDFYKECVMIKGVDIFIFLKIILFNLNSKDVKYSYDVMLRNC